MTIKFEFVINGLIWLWLSAVLVSASLILPSKGMASNTGEIERTKKYIANIEAEVGMSCTDFGKEAKQYVVSIVKPMLDLEKKGMDWLSGTDKNESKKINIFLNNALLCRNAQIDADAVGITMLGDFKHLSDILISLNTYISYSGDPPSSKGLKQDAFNILENRYRELVKQ